MINKVPNNWNYNDSMEMLFLFYQSTEEMLSNVSPDSYSLVQHNTITIIDELSIVYNILERHNGIDPLYIKYIPPIIDELLSLIEDDFVFKKILGSRLNRVTTGFREAKSNNSLLRRWIDYDNQSCDKRTYIDNYKKSIVELVSNNSKEKAKLIICIRNYFVYLVSHGYSREFLFTSSRRFFDNPKKQISSSDQIIEFLDMFNFEEKRFEFLSLIDMTDIQYLKTINENLDFNKHIEVIDKEELEKNNNGVNDRCVDRLLQLYDSKSKYGKNSNIVIVRIVAENLDPYLVLSSFHNFLKYIQIFSIYFKHISYSKRIFFVCIKSESGYFKEIAEPFKRKKRPYVQQQTIDSRINGLLSGKSISPKTVDSISRAFEMHAEAFDSRNTSTLFRTLWTSFETLFMDSFPDVEGGNVINNSTQIIQKTYILKRLRLLFKQLTECISKEELVKMNLSDFASFLLFFAKNDEKSSEMKKIYSLLSQNPLLRFRLFCMRKDLCSGNSIKDFLDNHKNRIIWQLNRIKRIRNIATHLGEEMPGAEIAVDHLHNYFDYVTNYIICKMENDDFVVSISSVVHEAKIDNEIHDEMLKKVSELSESNYLLLLFGPDKRIINYDFEF